MNLDELHSIALKMVAPGKGLLAADESGGTIGKRFDVISTANTEENRRDYREFMFRTNPTMKNNISGVILYDETIRQKAKDGSTLVSIIEAAGAIPGIKVDAGTTNSGRLSGRTDRSPRAWTGCASVSPNITSWAHVSPNGGR